MTVAFWQLVRTPPEQRDMQQARQGAQDAGTALVMLDRHLAGRDYVAGATLSMGDIPVGAMVYRWYALPDIERPELANLRAWYERLSERPAFQTHVMLPLT
jgi:glutathione S-transferase